MASLFDTLQANAFRAGVRQRTKQSQEWFQRNVTKLNVSRQEVFKDDALDRTSDTSRGSMYMFFYDPKLKLTLPYYDRFPLSIIIDSAPGGFYGLNLHYLNYNTRAAFLDNLMEFGPPKSTESSRLTKLRYNLLSGVRKFKEFKPCFKHYLGKHVKSGFAKVPMTDWEIAIFLPVEQFTKRGKESVWAESNKIARN
jgi:hypothetical protein